MILLLLLLLLLLLFEYILNLCLDLCSKKHHETIYEIKSYF